MTRPVAIGKTLRDDIYYCSSEDEDKWQEDDPVINCLAFGWLEGKKPYICPYYCIRFCTKTSIVNRLA